MDIESLQQLIARYFAAKPVTRAWLFGSFARGSATAWSDVDILIAADRCGGPFTLLTLGAMSMDLSELTGREVDLVEENGIEPIVATNVSHDKILIYERQSER